MEQPDRRDEELLALRERLARLSEASLRINESLEFDAVLQGVLDSARDLTRARYGAIILLDEEGQAEDVLSSGLTPEEAERLWKVPDAAWFFEHLGRIPEPLRLPDLPGYSMPRTNSIAVSRAHSSSCGLIQTSRSSLGNPILAKLSPRHHMFGMSMKWKARLFEVAL